VRLPSAIAMTESCHPSSTATRIGGAQVEMQRGPMAPQSKDPNYVFRPVAEVTARPPHASSPPGPRESGGDWAMNAFLVDGSGGQVLDFASQFNFWTCVPFFPAPAYDPEHRCRIASN